MNAMKNYLIWSLLAGLMVFSACNDDEETPAPVQDEEPSVELGNDSQLGKYLTDEEGLTLYFFTPDVDGNSACEGGCVGNWPLFYLSNIKVGQGLDAGDFGTIIRNDGEKQTTFKGWPLYYFSGDDQAGEINGDQAGGEWFVAKPDYSIMLGKGQLVGLDGKNYNGSYEEGEAIVEYFTNTSGRTLYIFVDDSKDTNNFTDPDFGNDPVWPIFHVDIEALPSVLNRDDFGEILVHGERKQLTYKGRPLYYFGQDENRGETKGVSFPEPGVWPIVEINTPTAE